MYIFFALLNLLLNIVTVVFEKKKSGFAQMFVSIRHTLHLSKYDTSDKFGWQ